VKPILRVGGCAAYGNDFRDGKTFPRRGREQLEFDQAIQAQTTDSELVAWAKERIPPERIKAANEWVLSKKENLDRQDTEEGVVSV
jgi:hypothetical protein